MALPNHPFRSMLYIPATRPKAMEKARGLPVDALIFDLEDAVLASEKKEARAAMASVLQGGFGSRQRYLRINALDTEWGTDDALAACAYGVDGVVLPKVESAEQLDALSDITGDMPIWAMIETPMGVLRASEIAGHPRGCGLIIGSNDLTKELGARTRPDRLPLITALSHCVLAARAHGVLVIDAVFNAFRDLAGLAAEAEQGRDLGFDGKTVIHPGQLEVANRVFAPDPDAVDLARRQIAAFSAAQEQGQGVAVLDGRIIEALHVEVAQRQVDRAKVIAEIEQNWHM